MKKLLAWMLAGAMVIGSVDTAWAADYSHEDLVVEEVGAETEAEFEAETETTAEFEIETAEAEAELEVTGYTAVLHANGGYFPDGSDTIEAPLSTDQYNHNYYFTEDEFIPVRDGYVFKGWYSDKECTNIVSSVDGDDWNKPSAWKVPASIMPDEIYAGWTTEYYTITFNGNGGLIMDCYDWSTGEKGDPLNLEETKSYKLPKGFSISYTDPYEYFAGIFVQGPDGKDFDCWNTKADGSGDSYYESNFYGKGRFTPTSDMTFYAQYEKYYVLHANGGTFSDGETEIPFEPYGEKLYLTQNEYKPTREGYAFTGWFKDAACTQQANTARHADIIDAENVVEDLYAGWTKDFYTITFDGNGGQLIDGFTWEGAVRTGVIDPQPSRTSLVPKGKRLSYILIDGDYRSDFVIPPKGLQFEIWNTKADGTGENYYESYFYDYDSDEKTDEEAFIPKSDMTFYAKYEKGGNVSYAALHANGGAFGDGITDRSISVYYYDDGVRLNDKWSEVPEREGYAFIGWYADKECTKLVSTASNAYIVDSEKMCSDIYAGWTDKYVTVIFDANGGQIANELERFSGGYSVRYAEDRKTVLVPNGYKLNYSALFRYYSEDHVVAPEEMELDSWNTKKDGTGDKYTLEDFTDSFAPAKNLTLYAQYNEKDADQKVTLDANGGVFTDGNTTYRSWLITDNEETWYYFNEYYQIPTREGYVFKGWYADAACTKLLSDTVGNEYNKCSAYKIPTGDITSVLYAGWTKDYYTITFNGNGGLIMDHYDWSTGEQGDPINLEKTKSYKLPKGFSVSYTNLYEYYRGVFIQSPKGKQFDCWNTKADGSGETYYGSSFHGPNSFTPTSDMTFYAQYEAGGDVSHAKLHANGGVFTDGKDTAQVYVRYGLNGVHLHDTWEVPSREGYAFTGWYAEEDCKTLVSKEQFAYIVESDKMQEDLYAGWTDEYYTVTFIANGGMIVDTYEDFLTQEDGINPEAQKTVIVPKGYRFHFLDIYAPFDEYLNIPPEGKKLDSWNTKADGSGVKYSQDFFDDNHDDPKPESEAFIPTSNMVFYAQYVEAAQEPDDDDETLIVTFDAGEGLFPENHVKGSDGIYSDDLKLFSSYTYKGNTLAFEYQVEDEYSTLPDDPVLEGKVFAGWYKDPQFKFKVIDDDFRRIAVTEDTTYYAKFIESGLIVDIPLFLYESRNLEVTAKVVSDEASPITWTSSNEKVIAFRATRMDKMEASVTTASPILEAVGEGTATVTVTAGDYVYTADLTVEGVLSADVSSVEFDKNEPESALITFTIKNCSKEESVIEYKTFNELIKDAVVIEKKSDAFDNATMTRTTVFELSLNPEKAESLENITGYYNFNVFNSTYWWTFDQDIRITITGEDMSEINALWKDIDERDRETLFNNDKKSILNSGLKVSEPEGTFSYTGEAITFDSDVRVYYNGKRLAKGKEYSVTYKNNTKVYTGSDKKVMPSYTVTLLGDYSGSYTGYFAINPASIEDTHPATGNAIADVSDKKINPALKVVNNDTAKELKAGVDYEVFFNAFTGEGEAYAPDFSKKLTADEVKNLGEGSYLINYEGKGNYEGVFATAESYEKATVLRVVDKEKSKKDGVLFLNDASKITVKTENYKETDGEADVLSKNVIEGFAKGTYKVKVGTTELTYVDDENVSSVKEEGYYFTVSDPADYDDEINRYPIQGNYVTLVPTNVENNKLEGELRVPFTIAGRTIDVEDMASKIQFLGYPIINGDEESEDVKELALMSIAKSGTETAKVIDKNDSAKKALSADCFEISATGDDGELGAVTLVFTGNPMKGYTGTVTKKVNIIKRKITAEDKKNNNVVVLFAEEETSSPITVPFSKAGATPEVTVRVLTPDGYMDLTEDEDYTVSYSGNKKVSSDIKKAKVSVKFKGNYSGSYKNALEFTVDKAVFEEGTITAKAADKVYSKKPKKNYFKSVPVLYNGDAKLSKSDFEIVGDYKYYIDGKEIQDSEYKSIPANSEIEVRFTARPKAGSKNFKAAEGDGTVEFSATYTLGTYKMSKAKVTIENQSYNNGKEVIPDKSDIKVTIKNGGQTITADEDEFEIVSVSKNKKVGTATIVLQGKGRFCGTKKASFKIK